MKSCKFIGTSTEGKLVVLHKAVFNAIIRAMPNFKFVITLEPVRQTAENYYFLYYWGELMPVMYGIMRKNGWETVQTIDEVDMILRHKFLGYKHFRYNESKEKIDEIQLSLELQMLSNQQWVDYLDAIRLYAKTEFNSEVEPDKLI
jgi:hypothetical protein